ncbi:OLC1v1010246C2 [Oldenlandia corymbosa var. corymbosa]|uniref:OLC1v1010246C2 n=1 Tax=Oldenlandia corymbosa var. corymbosa TaxID=529605 RepID=A0AAV1DSI6_OLDCO|nr:OLC1v1010246C2 [Oldenlandia corymbosa var. corymbosa]
MVSHQYCCSLCRCIPYRYKLPLNKTSFVDEDSLEVLVISAKRKCKGLLFPRGGWETDESMQEAAQRETVEEAGVVGDLAMYLGKWKGQKKESYMFGLLVKEQLEFWPEQDKRQRIWMSVKEARKECKQDWMSGALETLVKGLTTNENEANLGCGFPLGVQDNRRCNL